MMNSLIFQIAVVVTFMFQSGFSAPTNSISMKVVNHAGNPIELFWINTFEPSRDLVAQTKKPLRNSTDAKINSYEGHTFQAQFLNHIPGTEVIFTKGPEEETFTITYDSDLNLLVARQSSSETEIMDMVSSAIDNCENKESEEALNKCIAKVVSSEIDRLLATKATMEEYRNKMSDKLRNYTCADTTLKTSEAIRSYRLKHLDKVYPVNVLLDQEHAKIWTVEDFVTAEECAKLIAHARPNLSKATVASEDGSSSYSENRKAQQAHYDVNAAAAETDPLWPLYSRILYTVNHHANHRLLAAGQEGFTIIQYGPGDEYLPHCDGSCDGTLHKLGGRVATAVLYCEIPEEGGATTFSKADIIVKPSKGTATFFSYKSAKDHKMDTGYTEHSGCPIVKGEKWIATAWLREGVNEEDSWVNFDPEGIPLIDSSSEEIAATAAAATPAVPSASKANHFLHSEEL